MRTFHTMTALICSGARVLLAALPAQAIPFLFAAPCPTPDERAQVQIAGVAAPDLTVWSAPLLLKR